MDPGHRDGDRLLAEEQEEDAGAGWDAGPVVGDRERGTDADDAELLSCSR